MEGLSMNLALASVIDMEQLDIFMEKKQFDKVLNFIALQMEKSKIKLIDLEHDSYDSLDLYTMAGTMAGGVVATNLYNMLKKVNEAQDESVKKLEADSMIEKMLEFMLGEMRFYQLKSVGDREIYNNGQEWPVVWDALKMNRRDFYELIEVMEVSMSGNAYDQIYEEHQGEIEGFDTYLYDYRVFRNRVAEDSCYLAIELRVRKGDEIVRGWREYAEINRSGKLSFV